MVYQIIWTISARNDLYQISKYIEQDSPEYAKLFVKNVFENVKKLEKFPFLGRKIPESDDPNDREIIFQNYRIIYLVSEQKVEIENILHGKRLYQPTKRKTK